MSGGYKWIELGIHHVVHDDAGKILGHIIVDAQGARKCPIVAYVDGKQIGTYISAAFAREAVEEAMNTSRQNAGSNAGKIEFKDGA